jgi:hypothetical protein
VKNQTAEKDEHGMLETTAQVIGSTLGNLAVKTGFAKPQAAAADAEPSAAASKPAHKQVGHDHPNRKARRAAVTAKKKK